MMSNKITVVFRHKFNAEIGYLLNVLNTTELADRVF